MTDPITTDVAFADLQAQYDDELADLREAYEELVEYARDEYGDQRGEWPKGVRQYATVLDESGKSIQKRQHVLETLASEYDGDTFGIKMLSGAELVEVETELRMEARKRDADPDAVQSYRQQLTVDTATVDAPAAVPTDDDGSPLPSECPNPLTISLYEQVERLNQAGSTDFRAPGFGDEASGAASPTSDRPRTSSELSKPSAGIDAASPQPGDSS